MARFILNKPLRKRLTGTADGDLVMGSRQRPWISIRRGGELRLKGGDDRVFGLAMTPDQSGVTLEKGVIRSGAGDDELVGIGGIQAWDSTIDTGSGADSIIGFSNRIALNLGGSIVTTGPGDDRIRATRGTSRKRPWIGLYVGVSSVDTGKGDDRIVAYGRLAGLVLDDGGLTTGKGNDTVDVRHGGLATGYASEPLNLGPGDDRFIGFAAKPSSFGWGSQEPASVRGGRGTDTLVLPPGTYSIEGEAVIGAHNTLMASGFERLEAFGGGARPFSDGTFLVDRTAITALA
jgi:hypothetical protein